MELDAWQGTAVGAACVLAVIGLGIGELRARDRRVMNARPAESFVAAPPATPSAYTPTPQQVEDAKGGTLRGLGNEPDASWPPRGPSKPGTSKVRASGPPVVNGRLPKEVVQRILRQNFGRFRLCYESGLRTNAALAGSVVLKFVIGRDGSVVSAADGGSTLPDLAVVACVVRSLPSIAFPPPDGGIVTVVQPLELAP
jgi:hypothetical protein